MMSLLLANKDNDADDDASADEYVLCCLFDWMDG